MFGTRHIKRSLLVPAVLASTLLLGTILPPVRHAAAGAAAEVKSRISYLAYQTERELVWHLLRRGG
jgi:hypothetical protein